MYSLKVLKSLQHPDGRIFEPGHDCHSLDLFELAELMANYPDHFAPSDDVTAEAAADSEKMAHYAEASGWKSAAGLSGSVKASKK